VQDSCNVTAGGTYSNHYARIFYTKKFAYELDGADVTVSQGSVGPSKFLIHWIPVVHFPFRKVFKAWSYYSPHSVLITWSFTYTVRWCLHRALVLRSYELWHFALVYNRKTFFPYSRLKRRFLFYDVTYSIGEYKHFGGNFCLRYQRLIFLPTKIHNITIQRRKAKLSLYRPR
jgi:hypothetical protein